MNNAEGYNNDEQKGNIEKSVIEATLRSCVVIVSEKIMIGDIFKFDNFQSE